MSASTIQSKGLQFANDFFNSFKALRIIQRIICKNLANLPKYHKTFTLQTFCRFQIKHQIPFPSAESVCRHHSQNLHPYHLVWGLYPLNNQDYNPHNIQCQVWRL